MEPALEARRGAFDYKSWADPTYKKGDMGVLAGEARAIAALASAQLAPTECTACGAEEKDESRFCRHCGAPKRAEQVPAEVDLLRSMAETRAGQIPLKYGAGLLVISSVITLIAAIFATVDGGVGLETLNGILFIAGAIGLVGLIGTILAMRRLRRALAPETAENQQTSVQGPPATQFLSEGAQRLATSPPAEAQPSVTERTTTIFMSDGKERVTAPRGTDGSESD
jgi:hypothetical protein